jgi:hypothetical protein
VWGLACRWVISLVVKKALQDRGETAHGVSSGVP